MVRRRRTSSPCPVAAGRDAWRCALLGRWGDWTPRLRGYRGRTETPPAKLSACATCHALGNIRTRITRAAPPVPRGAVSWSCGLAVGRDVPIAPPRRWRGARLGIVQNSHAHLCVRRATAVRTTLPMRIFHMRITRAARCPHRAAAPAPVAARHSRRRAIGAVRGLASCEIRTQYSHAHYPRGAMGTSRPTAITHAPSPAHRPWRFATPRWLTSACRTFRPLCSYTSRPLRSLCSFVLIVRTILRTCIAREGEALPLATPKNGIDGITACFPLIGRWRDK